MPASEWKIDKSTGQLISPDKSIVGVRSLSFGEEVNQTAPANVTINWNASLKQRVTMTGDVALAFLAPQGPTNGVLILEQDGVGGRAPTWPANARAGDGEVKVSGAPGSVTVLGVAFDGVVYHISATPNSADGVTTTLV